MFAWIFRSIVLSMLPERDNVLLSPWKRVCQRRRRTFMGSRGVTDHCRGVWNGLLELEHRIRAVQHQEDSLVLFPSDRTAE